MSFVYPSFLFALALIAVPIIIHIFNFQRPKKVLFSNIDFLKEVKSYSNARNKVKNLLVLLARCLFVICLVLAFAKPYFGSANASQDGPDAALVSVYVDNSYSMQAEKDGKGLLDLALAYADKIPAIFPKNSLFALHDNGKTLVFGNLIDANKFSEKITEMTFANSTKQLDQVYQKQKEVFQKNSRSGAGTIIWLTDFQKNTAKELANLSLDTSLNHLIFPILASNTSNLYIDSIWLDNPFVKAQENNTLYVKVKNLGKQDVTDKNLRLFIEETQVSATTIDLQAGAEIVAKLNFSVMQANTSPARVEIDDWPISFDNQYFFTLTAAPQIHIMAIGNSQDAYLTEVYANESFFEVKHFKPSAVDFAFFDKADLIILENMESLDASLQTAIQKAMKRGANLAIFPAPLIDAKSYQSLTGLAMTNLHVSAKYGELGEKVALEAPAQNNPFFDGVFERISAQMSMPLTNVGIGLPASGQVLLKTKANDPFLVKYNTGQSQIFAFASALHTQFSELPRHALFVPIMYKMAILAKKSSQKLAYTFSDQLISVSADSLLKEDMLKLVNGSITWIPEQRKLPGQVLLSVPKGQIPAGNYQIVRGRDEKNIGWLALNYDKMESDIEAYTLEQINEIFKDKPNVKVLDNLLDPDEFIKDFEQGQLGVPLWRIFIILALAFLLAEIVILRFWRT